MLNTDNKFRSILKESARILIENINKFKQGYYCKAVIFLFAKSMRNDKVLITISLRVIARRHLHISDVILSQG
jgi:hypothetical protein